MSNSIQAKPKPLSSLVNCVQTYYWWMRSAARRIAMNRGLDVTGLLGVLAEAKARGLVSRCQPVLNDMVRVAGFWIGDDLRARYLRALKEMD